MLNDHIHLFSHCCCPEQPKRWPCHWLTDWLTHNTFFCIQRSTLETCVICRHLIRVAKMCQPCRLVSANCSRLVLIFGKSCFVVNWEMLKIVRLWVNKLVGAFFLRFLQLWTYLTTYLCTSLRKDHWGAVLETSGLADIWSEWWSPFPDLLKTKIDLS